MIPFSKYHALGNDYLVLDPQKITSKLTLDKATIQRICHRNFGIGSDGILYGPTLDQGKISLQIFNPDGSEAEKSGNGVRIFSRYLMDEKYVKGPFAMQTLGGLVHVEFLADGQIKVDMGKAQFQSDKQEQIDLEGVPYQVNCVSMGNPHCVIPLQEISETLARRLGPLVENHVRFPNRINMQLLKVLDRKNIQIEIWERGAGYTLASGSSSCAAASVAHKLGLVDSHVSVQMPGGLILIDIQKDGHVHMTGPVTKVAVGVLNEECL